MPSASEQKSKPSILIESDLQADQSPSKYNFYAQKVFTNVLDKAREVRHSEGENDEDSELGFEDEGTSVVFPIKFHDTSPKSGQSRVPRIRFPPHLPTVAEQPASPTSSKVANSEFSFNQRPAVFLGSAEVSEEISEESGDLREEEDEDSSLATEGRQVLPPVIKSPGRPLLLRPLQIKTSNLEAPSEPASKLKRCSTQATALQERKDSPLTLRGKFQYSLGPELHVADSLCSQVLTASSRGRMFTVYKYTKKKLKHMLLMRGRTALDVICQQIALMASAPPHPNVARLEEVIQTESRLYVVLGSDYDESLVSLAPITEEVAVRLFRKMLAAVDHLHREVHAGHFDLRPSSFHLSKSGNLELSWLHPVVPLSSLHEGEAKDMLALCAVLVTMMTGQPSLSEEAYESTLEQLQSGLVPSDLSLTPGFLSFLSYCISKQAELSIAVDLKGVRSLTSEEQISVIKATLEAQRARLEQKRFKSPELFKDSAAAFALRTRLQQALNRLDNSETRERATAELRLLIDKNRSEEALKVLITSLSEFRKSRSARAREQEAGLIGFIAEVYGSKLSDCTLSPLHYLLKLRDITLALFTDMHRNVQEAAASSLCQLYEHGLPKDDLRVVFDTIYEPLYGILLSGVDVKAQHGAAIALYQWTDMVAKVNNVQVLKELTPRVVNLYVKLRPEYPHLISALGILIDNIGLHDCVAELHPILMKTIQYLRAKDHGAFAMKVEACKLLCLLAQKLQKVVDIVIGFSTQEVMGALIDTKADKVPVVQANAREALEQWQLLSRMQARVEEDKMEMENIMGEELIKHRTGLAELPKLVKERTATLELPLALQEQFSDFRKTREAVKRRKEAKITVVKETPQATKWGVMKPKYLLKGTGHYTSIPVGTTETRTYEPIVSRTNMALPPYTPMIQQESTAAVNRDLLKAIIKTAPQKRVEPLSTEELMAQVKGSADHAARIVGNGLDLVGGKMKQVEKKAETIERRVANMRTVTDDTPDFQRAPSPEESPLPAHDSVTQMWLRALESYTQNDLNSAYQTLLEAGDDIYLMRMLHKTGLCLDSLSPETTIALMRRIGLLLGGFIIPDAAIQWCRAGVDAGMWGQLDQEVRDGVLEDVRAVEQTEAVGEEARTLLEEMEKKGLETRG